MDTRTLVIYHHHARAGQSCAWNPVPAPPTACGQPSALRPAQRGGGAGTEGAEDGAEDGARRPHCRLDRQPQLAVTHTNNDKCRLRASLSSASRSWCALLCSGAALPPECSLTLSGFLLPASPALCSERDCNFCSHAFPLNRL